MDITDITANPATNIGARVVIIGATDSAALDLADATAADGAT
jgi:hypothetical protein